ncbi:MAG TPA: xanthine dehydrogenase family protein subunit M [Chloroflexota bacterium]|nr:xanthine dehydrogenase family protein subunit M [Chloroflexota bacterium]
MKPPVFEYHSPAELTEALRLLDEYQDDDVKVLAGGQSLMPLLNMRLVRPGHIVDVNHVQGLDFVRTADDGRLVIGALARQRSLEKSPEIAARAPLMAEALPLIGDRQVRYRGTIGGSLAHADPAAELPLVAVALEAEIVLASTAGQRSVAAHDFFVGTLTTALGPNELIVEIQFPPLPQGAGCALLELARQHGAFAIASAAAIVTLSDGRIGQARLALGGVGPTPLRATAAEECLRGSRPTPDVLAQAGELAAAAADPSGDVHGSAEYRRKMAGVFARRALELALERAGNES